MKLSTQHPDNVPVMYNDVVLALPAEVLAIANLLLCYLGTKCIPVSSVSFNAPLILVVDTECTSRTQVWSTETSDRS